MKTVNKIGMKEAEEEKKDKNLDKIRIISSEDEKLKLLGELLSNKSSRDIIKLLMNKEMYTNEIATKLNMRVSLVIHHLRKLEDIGLLLITEKQIVRKGNKHRYFKMIPNLFLVPNQTHEEIYKNGFLKKFFKNGIKFVAVFLVAIAATQLLKISTIGQETKNIDIGNVISSIFPSTVEKQFPFEVLLLLAIPAAIIFWLIIKKKKRGGASRSN